MFSPGMVVSEFISKKGKQIVFRFPVIEDVEIITDYINELSREDTFIRFSGEQQTTKDEHDYLEKQIALLQSGDGVMVFAFSGDELIGSVGLSKMEKRSKHVGLLGISLRRSYRSEGIGSALLETVISLGQKIGIQMIELGVYSPNELGIHLYEKLGFKEVGRVPKKILFHGELVDEIIMVKFL